MKKPEAAIERMRGWYLPRQAHDDREPILAYLDSLKPWPADLTRRLHGLFGRYKNPYPVKFDRPVPYDEELAEVLAAVLALAPKREKRKVEIWEHEDGSLGVFPCPSDPAINAYKRRKVHGPFEIVE